ncbi:unnamed protein product, partial [Pocillopora meandrina]
SKSDGKGTCELNKHDGSVVKENMHLQLEEGATFSMPLKDCRLAASTCLNGGVCFYDEKKQTYSCECKPPWTGETCADLCKKQICRPSLQNHGTCTEVNEYNCSCAPGFYGTQCEKIEGLSCSSDGTFIKVLEDRIRRCFILITISHKNFPTGSCKRYLNNCAPTPALTQQSSIDNKLRSQNNFKRAHLFRRTPQATFDISERSRYFFFKEDCVLLFPTAYRMVFGQPNIKSYASITNATSSSLSEFTMCLFVKMKDTILNGEQCLYSYATIGAPGGMPSTFVFSNIVLIVYVHFLGSTDTRVKIDDTMWHHICVTWEKTKGDWQFYMDGQLQSNGTDLKKNHQIPAGGTVVIGQDQDSVGGGFDSAESFGPGEVTEVNLWSRVLSGDEIATQKANCDIAQAGLVLWWGQFKGNVTGVKIVEP